MCEDSPPFRVFFLVTVPPWGIRSGAAARNYLYGSATVPFLKKWPKNLPRPTGNLPARKIRADEEVRSSRHPDKLTRTIRVI